MKVPGTDYEVRAASAGDMIALMAAGDDEMRRLVLMAQVCTWRGDARVWADEQAAMQAPWPLVKACAEHALVVNGLTQGAEAIAGN